MSASTKHMDAARELALSSEGIYRAAEFEALARDIAIALSNAERGGMERAYLAGFAASREGWNGEYPFDDEFDPDRSPIKDEAWLAERDRFIEFILSEAGAG